MRWHYSPILFHVQAFQLMWYPWEQTRTCEDTITSSMTLCFPSKYTCKWHISVLGYTPLHFLLHFQCLHLMDGVPGAVANWTWIWVLSSCYSKNPWLDGLSVESDSGQKGIQILAGNFRRIDTQENCKWQLGSIVSQGTRLTWAQWSNNINSVRCPVPSLDIMSWFWDGGRNMMAMMCKGLELPLCKRDGNIKWDKVCSTAPIQRTLTGTPTESRDTESKIHLQTFVTKLCNPVH
jgi:hypothetical protein